MMFKQIFFPILIGSLVTLLFLSACGPSEKQLTATENFARGTKAAITIQETKAAMNAQSTREALDAQETVIALETLAAFEFEPGLIAFTSTRDGNGEIYIMNSDGTDVHRLAEIDGDEGYPIWSPDGTQIAFRTDQYHIYVINADGTNLRNVTSELQYYYNIASPTWSPDGKQIAFSADYRSNNDIFVSNVDGSNVRRLTQHKEIDNQPIWSPTGKQILFSSQRNGNSDIYVMTSGESELLNLTDTEESDSYATWSPDGTQIAYVTRFEEGKDVFLRLFVANADGTNKRQILPDDVSAYNLEWSPDGTQIAFYSTFEGNTEIYIVPLDGGEMRRMTTDEREKRGLSWSPDGGQLLYSVVYGSYLRNGELVMLNVKEPGMRLLSGTQNRDFNPAWQPVPLSSIPVSEPFSDGGRITDEGIRPTSSVEDVLGNLGNFPQPPGSAIGGDNAVVVLQNGTIYQLNVNFTGSQFVSETVSSCVGCSTGCISSAPTKTINLRPGSYLVRASVSDSSFTEPFVGTWNLEAGMQYSSCFYITSG